jgi:hypothetical protein
VSGITGSSGSAATPRNSALPPYAAAPTTTDGRSITIEAAAHQRAVTLDLALRKRGSRLSVDAYRGKMHDAADAQELAHREQRSNTLDM